jgi:3-hydroxyacyl-[acyl-carrier-protein] dehydratase
MTPNTLDNNQLRKILPQAYPFMLIDRVIDFKKGESLVAIKNITANEWPFTTNSINLDHYPETLLIEAAAQSALVLCHLSRVAEGETPPKFFLGRIKSEFSSQVSVGSQVRLAVKSGRMLADGGYSDIDIFENESAVSKVEIIYKIQVRKGL